MSSTTEITRCSLLRGKNHVWYLVIVSGYCATSTCIRKAAVSNGTSFYSGHRLIDPSYLSDLQQRLARLERSHSIAEATPGQHLTPQEHGFAEASQRAGSFQHTPLPVAGSGGADVRETSRSTPRESRESSPKRDQGQAEGPELTNPMIESPSKFMSSSSGRTCTAAVQDNIDRH